MVSNQNNLPLVVSLNGALLQSDTLLESIAALLKKNLLYLFLLPYWLSKGVAHLRHQVADRVDLDVAQLPYHAEFLSYLRKEAERKRKLVLATSANERHARRIARHISVFHEVIASSAQNNCAGITKLRSIEQALGVGQFVYAGGSMEDLPLFQKAAEVILVNPSRKLRRLLRDGRCSVKMIFESRTPWFPVLIKALRVHQWLKNLLVFVPAVAAHEIDVLHLFQGSVAFFAFSFCASGIYLLNDMLDLSADRAHPYKKARPFASGEMSLALGMVLVPIMLLTSIAMAMILSKKFVASLVLYFVLASLYSFYLKKKLVLDVIILTGLYILRVIAGGIAVSIGVTSWMLLFSLFIFMSLALIKRNSELARMKKKEKLGSGRAYRVEDLEYLNSMGTASGYLSVLVMALYINSHEVTALYDRPRILWFLCPLLLFWISRMWLLVGRGKMHDDPLVFTGKDPVSWLVGLCSFGIMLLAA